MSKDARCSDLRCRFGDYVSDQVVAPVRETSSQVLGVLLQDLNATLVRNTVNMMLSLQDNPNWEVCVCVCVAAVHSCDLFAALP